MGDSIIPAENCEKGSHSNSPKEGSRTNREAAEVIELSPEDSRIFAEALSRPPKPSAALRRAFELHRQMVISE